MAGLTAPPDNSQQTAGQIIEADGWFPGINTADVAGKIRIGEGVVTPARLAEAVTAGILAGLRELSGWRTVHAANGIASLADVTAAEIAGQNHAQLLWNRVVQFYAAAEIADGHIDVSATDDVLDRDDEKRDTADMYRRKAYEAVADLLSIGVETPVGRNTVELI